jgi:UDP-2-acetamido-3-amino-2,3-dideoxy-glucuronate N-acetyltransferase
MKDLINKDTKIGRGTRFGAMVVIEEECSIGEDCFIGNFTVFRPGTKIGNNTKIGHLCVFEGECSIGDNCVIQSQSHITLGAIIENDVFIGPGFLGSNDRRMVHLRRKIFPFHPNPFRINRASRIGSGAIIFPGVTIGENCVVGAGSIVTRDVYDFSIVIGSPAKKVGEVPMNERI